MDAELALDASITGTANDPNINGTARIVRGQFELLDATFADGNIRIAGDPMDARLDILAVRDTISTKSRSPERRNGLPLI